MAQFLLAKATISGTNTATRITAGQAVPGTRIPANSVLIQADPGNTADIYIGDSTVQSSTTLGIVLSARQSIQIDGGAANNPINLADIYFASATATQKVNVIYVQI